MMLAFYHGGGLGSFVAHAIAWDLIGATVRSVTHGMGPLALFVLTCAFIGFIYLVMRRA